MIIIGANEVAEGKVAVRSRRDGDLGAVDMDKFISDAVLEIAEKRR